MQLLPLTAGEHLGVGAPVEPLRFQDLTVSGHAARESDLEDLLVRYPSLLNTSDGYRPGAEPDLLFVGRQPLTATRKRFDLLAIDRDGTLVLVEVKRDASDEKARREAMEFQAIRYAAACRTMSAQDVVDQLARYLQQTNPGESPDAGDDQFWTRKAQQAILNHVESDVGAADLASIIDPRNDLRILLVAADYEEDMLSACAWLLEKEIDVVCLRLRPYRIGTDLFLEREQLIPPPALDDFFVAMADPAPRTAARASGPRQKQDRAQSLQWLAPDGEVESEAPVNSWREALQTAIVRVVAEDGPDAVRGTSIRSASLDAYTSDSPEVSIHAPFELDEHDLVLDLHGAAAQIRKYLAEVLAASLRGHQVTVVTKSGDSFTIPETRSQPVTKTATQPAAEAPQSEAPAPAMP